MSRILSTFAPSSFPDELLGSFASAGDAIFRPLLLRFFMPCRWDLRVVVRGIRRHYYESRRRRNNHVRWDHGTDGLGVIELRFRRRLEVSDAYLSRNSRNRAYPARLTGS